jgi:hypothetical protein
MRATTSCNRVLAIPNVVAEEVAIAPGGCAEDSPAQRCRQYPSSWTTRTARERFARRWLDLDLGWPRNFSRPRSVESTGDTVSV